MRLLRRASRQDRARLLTRPERFSIVTVALLLLLALIPAAITALYANMQLKSLASSQDTVLLERIRDEQVLKLQGEYALVESQMIAYGGQMSFRSNGKPIAPEETFLPAHVRAVYWFDPSLSFAGVLKSGVAGDVPDMQERLSATAFTGAVSFGQWVSLEGSYFQIAYLRLASADGVTGFVGFIVDNGILSQPLATSPRGYITDVLDGEFMVLYSTDSSRVGTQRLNELTKRMLAGNVASENFDGYATAYGFVDIGDNPLYVQVTQTQTANAGKAASALKIMIFIMLISMIVAFVVAWKYLRSLHRYAGASTGAGLEERRRHTRSEISTFLEDSDDWDTRLDGMSAQLRGFRATLTELRDDLATTADGPEPGAIDRDDEQGRDEKGT